MKAITWKVKENQFGPHSNIAYINQVKVGSVTYNGIYSDENTKYVAFVYLPSIRLEKNCRPTEKEAVEKVVSNWFKETE